MKNKLHIVLTAMFGVSAFGFWLFVRPALVIEREALQLFLWNSDYLTERLSVPGGFARYVGEFLVQFFISEAIGACILAVVLMLVQWLVWVLLRRCMPTFKEMWLFAASFLPSIALWYMLCDIDTSMTLPVAVILTLGMMMLLPSGRKSSKIVSFILVPIGYWIAGPMAILIAVYQLSIVMTLLLVGCVYVSSFFVPYSLSNMAKGIDYVSIQSGKIGTIEMMEYDYLLRQKAWGKIIQKANEEAPHARACMSVVNLASYYQKQMSPEALQESMYQPYKSLTSAVSAMMMGDIFFQMGFVNFSQRAVFEAMESASNFNKSSRVLCRLTETAIVTGQYEVALKYISILEETLMYRRWAQYMKQLATHPEDIKNHPLYGPLQQIYGETEDTLFI